MYGTPSRQEQERLARVREAAKARASSFGRPMGPQPGEGNGLENRRGVADGVPQRQLTPEQSMNRHLPTANQEMPHGPNAGRIWDQRFQNGQGGFGMRAPDPGRDGPQIKIPEGAGDLLKFSQDPRLSSITANDPDTWEQAEYDEKVGQGDIPEDMSLQEVIDYDKDVDPADRLLKTKMQPLPTRDSPAEMREDRARMFGLDPSAYGPEAQAQLTADMGVKEARHNELSKKYDTIQVPGGGYRYTPNQAMRDSVEDRHGRRFLDEQWAKYRDVIQKGGTPMQFQDFAQQFQGGNFRERAASLQKFLSDSGVKANIQADLRQNVRTRAEQDNMARRMNTPVANIVYGQSLRNAKTPEDLARVMFEGHVINPRLGLGNAGSMILRGQDDLQAQQSLNESARQQAEANDPIKRADSQLASIHQMKDHGQFSSSLAQHYARLFQGQNITDPNHMPRWMAGQKQSRAGQMARALVAGQININTDPGVPQFISDYTREYRQSLKGYGMSDKDIYQNWISALGLQETPENSAKLSGLFDAATGVDGRTWTRWAGDLGGAATNPAAGTPGMPPPPGYTGPDSF